MQNGTVGVCSEALETLITQNLADGVFGLKIAMNCHLAANSEGAQPIEHAPSSHFRRLSSREYGSLRT